MYLIYETKQGAIDRADGEGRSLNFSYWTEGKGTRWLTAPVPTADDKWALDVRDYSVSEDEISSSVDTYLPLPTIN